MDHEQHIKQTVIHSIAPFFFITMKIPSQKSRFSWRTVWHCFWLLASASRVTSLVSQTASSSYAAVRGIVSCDMFPIRNSHGHIRNEDHWLDSPKATFININNSNTRISTTMSRSAFVASLATIAVASFTPSSSAAAASTLPESNPPTTPTKSTTTTNIIATSKNTQQESVSGFFAGAALTVAKTVVKYPLDTATVRLQMPNSPINYRDIRNLPALFDNVYQGISLPLLTNIPAGAVFFAVKDAVQAALLQTETITTQNPNVDRIWRTCCAVAVAQIPYWIVRNPSEVVKTRQQAKIPPYDQLNAIDAYWQVRQDRIAQLQQLVNTNVNSSSSLPLWSTIGGGGWDAYYTGYFENVLYAYPADVIKFVVYEQLSASILQQQRQQQNYNSWNTQRGKKLSPIQGALAGATATAVAQFLTTPLDVVRNRVMANTGPQQPNKQLQSTKSTFASKNGEEKETMDKNKPDSASVLSSYWNELAALAREEGWKGLFAGATPRVGKALLSGAIQFATYEETKQQVAQFFQRKE